MSSSRDLPNYLPWNVETNKGESWVFFNSYHPLRDSPICGTNKTSMESTNIYLDNICLKNIDKNLNETLKNEKWHNHWAWMKVFVSGRERPTASSPSCLKSSKHTPLQNYLCSIAFDSLHIYISQSNSIYSGTTIIAGAKSDFINSSVNMPQAGIEPGLRWMSTWIWHTL